MDLRSSIQLQVFIGPLSPLHSSQPPAGFAQNAANTACLLPASSEVFNATADQSKEPPDQATQAVCTKKQLSLNLQRPSEQVFGVGASRVQRPPEEVLGALGFGYFGGIHLAKGWGTP